MGKGRFFYVAYKEWLDTIKDFDPILMKTVRRTLINGFIPSKCHFWMDDDTAKFSQNYDPNRYYIDQDGELVNEKDDESNTPIINPDTVVNEMVYDLLGALCDSITKDN